MDPTASAPVTTPMVFRKNKHGKPARRPDGKVKRNPGPAPQYRSVMRRSILALHNEVRAALFDGMKRAGQGRYSWVPWIERMKAQNATQQEAA